MPNLQNAKKALRQAQKRAVQNKIVKEAYKGALKAVEKGETDLTPLLQEAQKRLDKASKRGVLKKNAAARKLSRLSKYAKRALAEKK